MSLSLKKNINQIIVLLIKKIKMGPTDLEHHTRIKSSHTSVWLITLLQDNSRAGFGSWLNAQLVVKGHVWLSGIIPKIY